MEKPPKISILSHLGGSWNSSFEPRNSILKSLHRKHQKFTVHPWHIQKTSLVQIFLLSKRGYIDECKWHLSLFEMPFLLMPKLGKKGFSNKLNRNRPPNVKILIGGTYCGASSLWEHLQPVERLHNLGLGSLDVASGCVSQRDLCRG